MALVYTLLEDQLWPHKVIKGAQLEDFIVFVSKTKKEAQNWATYPTSFPPDSKGFHLLSQYSVLLDLQLSSTHSSVSFFPENPFNWQVTAILLLPLLLLL